MATITIESPSSISIDGIQFGSVVDTAMNNTQHASDIQRALEAAWSNLLEVHATALQTESSAREALRTELTELQDAVFSNNPERIASALIPRHQKEALLLDQQIAELEAKRSALPV